MESTTVLFQLEGLPFSVNKKDVQAFFRDSSLMEDDISILKDAEDRCLGLAFVRFHTELEASVATRHCGIEIGGNRVSMKQTTFQDMVTTKQRLESASSHSTRRKISEPISVSPERKGLGLRSPTGPNHSATQRRSEERSKAIHRLPFQQMESVASMRESVERQRNRSRSPHRTRAGGSGSSYQPKGSPYSSHSSGTQHEPANHRQEKVARHQYGREEPWAEGLRETAAHQQRIDSRSSHVEMMTWSSSSSRGSARSDAMAEREARAREELKRDATGPSSSSVYRQHQMGSSDGMDHLHYQPGSRVREVEERKGQFRRKTYNMELVHGSLGDRTPGTEDHRGYSGGRFRDIDARGGHSGSRSNEVEVRGRHLGSSNREVEVRGRRSGSRNREVETRSGHLGNREAESRGGYLGSRSREVEVQSRQMGSRHREEHDYRGHLGSRNEEGSRSGHSLERGDAVGYKSSLDHSRPSVRRDANSGDMLDVPPAYVVKLMGFPPWFAFKEIRHMLGRSVTVIHGGIHFVKDARRPTAFVSVDGDSSYDNALRLDGLAINKQCTLTVLGSRHPKRDKGGSEGDDLRRVLEKKREPKNHSSHDSSSSSKRSSYTGKRSDHSPVPHRRHSPEVASRDHSYSPGRAQKLADEFWGTGSHSDQRAEYPTTHTGEGVRPRSYPTQWQGENGHFVQGLHGFHTTEVEGQPLQQADFQSQVEGGFMEAALEYPEYFTREELEYTGEHTQQPRFTAPFSSQPEYSEDYIALGGVPLDNVFRVPTSDTEDASLRPSYPRGRGEQNTPPAPDSTLSSVVHVVNKGRDSSGVLLSEYRHSEGSSGGHGRVTRADMPTTVRCANLPTSVVVTDILGFLHDDSLSYDSVRIQCDDNGKPTGKCFITFPTQQQAVRAVRRHSNQRLKENKVSLELVL